MAYTENELPSGLEALSSLATDDILITGDTSDSGRVKGITKADLNTDLANEAATLTNKTIALGSNTVSGTTAQFNTALSDGDFATQAGSESLTNKTIALGSNTVSGTTAQFNTALSDGDFATLAGSETLSNKTLTTPKIADGGSINDESGNEQIKFSTTASAVNEVTHKNAATGNPPQIQATGGDTDISLSLVPKGAGIVKGELKRFAVRLLGSTTDTATGNAIGGDYRISNRAITVKAVGMYVDTAGTTNLTTVDINEAGTTILSTKITIDSTEKSSETAATPPVISDSAIAADAIVTFDVDAVHTTAAKGLTVWIDYIYA